MKIAILSIVTVVSATAALAGNVDFETAMNAAMTRMHAGMMTRYSGNPDRDFAAMMIPHHQGAIDMAKLELSHGKDERLRRLAQGIIVEQEQEIAVMKGILSEPGALPPPQRSGPVGVDHEGSEQ